MCIKWSCIRISHSNVCSMQEDRATGESGVTLTVLVGSSILLFNYSSNVTFYEYNLSLMYPRELNPTNWDRMTRCWSLSTDPLTSTYSETGLQCLPENTNEMWGSATLIEDDEEYYLLGRDIVYFGGNLLTFRRNALPSFSSSNIKPSKQTGRKMICRQLSKCTSLFLAFFFLFLFFFCKCFRHICHIKRCHVAQTDGKRDSYTIWIWKPAAKRPLVLGR
jgi:hypothetical protein